MGKSTTHAAVMKNTNREFVKKIKVSIILKDTPLAPGNRLNSKNIITWQENIHVM
jgi:hypothetical protein